MIPTPVLFLFAAVADAPVTESWVIWLFGVIIGFLIILLIGLVKDKSTQMIAQVTALDSKVNSIDRKVTDLDKKVALMEVDQQPSKLARRLLAEMKYLNGGDINPDDFK